MTAYGALISLGNTMQNVIKSFISGPFNDILEATYKELQPLQKVLERLDGNSKRKSRKKVNALDGRIKQKLWDFEDLLETLFSDGIHRGRVKYESLLSDGFPKSVLEVRFLQEDVMLTHVPRLHEAADSFIRMLEDMKEEYVYEVDNMPKDGDDEEEEEAAAGGMNKSKMIGLSDEFTQVKFFIRDYDWPSIMSYSIVGMAGLGKTTLARKIYQDPDIQSYFDCVVNRTTQMCD